MIYDSAFWILLASMAAPALWLAWIRSRTIGRIHQSICGELRKAGIPLSNDENELLLGRLVWNPQAAVDTDDRAESRAIKQRHVAALIKSLRVIRTCFWALLITGSCLMFWFQLIWSEVN